MPRPLPGGAGKNQASHSICSHPACSFTLVASACPGEDVAPAATSSKDSWAPGCRRPPPQPLAPRPDDLLFPGCWEITGGEGLTALTWSWPATLETQLPYWPREIQSAALPAAAALLPGYWSWTDCGACECPPSHAPSKCPVNGASLPLPLAFSPFSSSALGLYFENT